MAEIILNDGQRTKVDDCHFEIINTLNWCFSKKYAVCWDKFNKCHTSLHYFVFVFLNKNILLPGYEIDHKNGDKLDNQGHNLRALTVIENRHNTKLFSTNTSGYKGVRFDKTRGKWKATIHCGRGIISLGSFVLIEDAIKARQNAEQILFPHIFGMNG